MITAFDKLVKSLKLIVNRFDDNSNQQKLQYLLQLSSLKLNKNKGIINYFEVLLFICAYPADERMLTIAERELLRMTKMLKRSRKHNVNQFTNSGLPYTRCISKFSHDFVLWLILHPDCRIIFEKFENESFDLNEVLKLTLPPLERSETTAGLNNMDLLHALLVKKQNQLTFLVSELSKFNDFPYVKDHLYDGLGIYTCIFSKDHLFSRAYNRLPVRSIFFHKELIKNFDHEYLLNTKLPKALTLSDIQISQAITTVKNAMALTDRETDPTTYLDEQSFRLFELEHGISVAIYAMIPGRQLPLESYVGYTLFKNGYPLAYGGGWVFGERANFGINIFDSYRGGESGYMMCQLLRVYRQVFNISYFEVEPYQFGLDNPEGIESAAFWFYYRYGFRPLDKGLLRISDSERKKIAGSKTYRTSRKILEKFTGSNIAFNLDNKIPVRVPDIITKVIRMIQQNYNGNRLLAENESVIKFRKKTGLKKEFNKFENQVLQEVALWADAFDICDKDKLNILTQMIKIKPINVYKYQKLLVQFFGK